MLAVVRPRRFGLAFGSPGGPGVRATKEDSSMTYIIAEPCIDVKDTACVEVCPVDCIHPKKDEAEFAAENKLYIDPETCIDCGACVTVCPVQAIFPQE